MAAGVEQLWEAMLLPRGDNLFTGAQMETVVFDNLFLFMNERV